MNTAAPTRFALSVAMAMAMAMSVLLPFPAAAAADACSNYKWDVGHEVQLYATPPTAVQAGADAKQAPLIVPDTHYALTLQPQEQVQYLVAPTKRMLADGAFGGLLKFRLARAGAYRVAIDAGYWLDVVQDGKSLATLDFNGVRECAGPHKIVVFDMPAGVELWLQLAASSTSTARLTLTPVGQPAP